jgi:hypothetical protein
MTDETNEHTFIPSSIEQLLPQRKKSVLGKGYHISSTADVSDDYRSAYTKESNINLKGKLG